MTSTASASRDRAGSGEGWHDASNRQASVCLRFRPTSRCTSVTGSRKQASQIQKTPWRLPERRPENRSLRRSADTLLTQSCACSSTNGHKSYSRLPKVL